MLRNVTLRLPDISFVGWIRLATEFKKFLPFCGIFVIQVEIDCLRTRCENISYKGGGLLDFLSAPFEKCIHMITPNPITLAITRCSSSFRFRSAISSITGFGIAGSTAGNIRLRRPFFRMYPNQVRDDSASIYFRALVLYSSFIRERRSGISASSFSGLIWPFFTIRSRNVRGECWGRIFPVVYSSLSRPRNRRNTVSIFEWIIDRRISGLDMNALCRSTGPYP